MADSAAFAWTCAEIVRSTALSELVARGTVRLALKQAGLTPDSVNGEQMAVVLREILPQELANRAVSDAAKLCRDLGVRIRSRRFEGDDGAAAVFSRLGGGK
jgi:hypothetical protein